MAYDREIGEPRWSRLLRRGRGEGVLRALNAPRPQVHDVLYSMIIEAQRPASFLVFRSDSRARYLAYLVERTVTPLGPVEDHLRSATLKGPPCIGEFDSRSDAASAGNGCTRLSIDVLGVLAARGNARAAHILAESIAYSEDVPSIVSWLAKSKRTDLLRDAHDVVAVRFGDDEIELRWIFVFLPHELRVRWVECQPVLVRGWKSVQAARRRRIARRAKSFVSRADLEQLPFTDLMERKYYRDEEDFRLLAQSGAREFGTDLRERLLAWIRPEYRMARRWIASKEGRLHRNAVWLLCRLPRDVLLPLVHEWSRSSHQAERGLAMQALARMARVDDLELVRSMWPEAWSARQDEEVLVVRLLRAFGRIRRDTPHPELEQAYEEVELSHVRAVAAEALAESSPDFFSARLARESLWDCEPATNRVAIEHVDSTVPGVARRIAEIARDPAAEGNVRDAARKALR